MYEYLSSCAVGFERIFTCMCEKFFWQYVLHNGLLTKRYVPPSEGMSCILKKKYCCRMCRYLLHLHSARTYCTY